jgi:hypothetical protein
VEAPVAQHRQDQRVLEGGSSYGNAQVRFPFRQVQGAGAVSEHGGKRLASVQPSLVHLGDVRDEVRLSRKVPRNPPDQFQR